MYWKHNTATSPAIDAVLDRENVTLQDLMDEDDVLQECKSQHKKLIDFLVRQDIMEELVTLITTNPSPDLDERHRFKYPNIACELLTCDVPAIYERLANDGVLLEKLYMFLEHDAPLNPLLASYFSKTLGKLLSQRGDQDWYSYQVTCLQVLEFLKSKENFVMLLVRHLDTSAIMDFMLKLITNIDGAEIKQNILNWLDSEHLVQSLIELIHPSIDPGRQSYAAQLLSDIIARSRDSTMNVNERANPDPVVTAIESCETIISLLDNIFKEEKVESTIVAGIQVLLALLNFNKGSNNDSNFNLAEISQERTHREKVITNLTTAIVDRLKDFVELLKNPPAKPAILTTVGKLNPPFGSTRLHVAKLISSLLACNNPDLNKEIARLDTLPILFDLFIEFPYNNFLHTQMQNCLENALVPPYINQDKITEELIAEDYLMFDHLLNKSKLLSRIVDTWTTNEDVQVKKKGKRAGYMGHLTNISNNIVQKAAETCMGSFIEKFVDPAVLEKWNTFVNGPLRDINQIQSNFLGGSHPSTSHASDSQDEYSVIQFPSSYSDYNRVPVSTFQFSESDFESDINDAQNASLFEKNCSERTSGSLFLHGGDADMWENKPDVTSRAGPSQVNKNLYSGQKAESGDDTWKHKGSIPERSVVNPVVGGDPWASNSSVASIVGEGWANFDSFSNFEASFNGLTSESSTSGQNMFDAFISQFDYSRTQHPVEDTPIDFEQSITAATQNLEQVLESKKSDDNPDDNANLFSVCSDELSPEHQLVDNVRTFLSNSLEDSVEITDDINEDKAPKNIPDSTSEISKQLSQVDLDQDSKPPTESQENKPPEESVTTLLDDTDDEDDDDDDDDDEDQDREREKAKLTITLCINAAQIPVVLDGYVMFVQRLWCVFSHYCADNTVDELGSIHGNYQHYVRMCVFFAKVKLYYAQINCSAVFPCQRRYTENQLARIQVLTKYLPYPLTKALDALGTFYCDGQIVVPFLDRRQRDTGPGVYVWENPNFDELFSETNEELIAFLKIMDSLKARDDFIVPYKITSGIGTLAQAVRFPGSSNLRNPKVVFYMNVEVPMNDLKIAIAVQPGSEFNCVKVPSRFVSSLGKSLMRGTSCHLSAVRVLIGTTAKGPL